jgi:hypothetical protein
MGSISDSLTSYVDGNTTIPKQRYDFIFIDFLGIKNTSQVDTIQLSFDNASYEKLLL